MNRMTEREHAALRREVRYASYIGALVGFLIASLLYW